MHRDAYIKRERVLCLGLILRFRTAGAYARAP